MVRKNEFITEIVKKVDGLTKKDTAIILDAISETITECLVAGGKGEKINLPGLGSLEVRERAGREGRNPQTGEKIDIPAKLYVKFKASKAFKDAIAE